MRVPLNKFPRLSTKAMTQLPARPWIDSFEDDAAWAKREKDRPQNPYAQVVALNACVQLKCNSLAQVPVRLSDNDDNVIETGPDVDLLRRPNPVTTWPQFIKDTVGFLSVRGRVYWWRITNGVQVLEVYVLNPMQIKPRLNRDGDLVAWIYKPSTSPDSDAIVLDPADVHEIKYRDYCSVDAPGHAVSPIETAEQSISQVYKAQVANEASLDNGLELGGLLKMPGTPTQEHVRDIRQEVNERHAGVRQRKKFMVLYGGLEYQQMQAMFKDMEFTTLLKMNRSEICVSQGVPPALVYGAEQSSLGSGKELDAHKLTLWESTLIPMAFVIAENWDMFIVDYHAQGGKTKAIIGNPMRRPQVCCKAFKEAKLSARSYDRELFVWFDTSVVPVIQDAALAQAMTAAELNNCGIPINYVIDALDLPFEHTPGGDTVFIEASKVDIRVALGLMPDPRVQATQAADSASEEHTTPTTEKPEPTQDIPDDVDEATEPPVDRETKMYTDALTKSFSPDHRAELWEAWFESWGSLRKEMASKVSRHFFDLRKDSLARLDQLPETKSLDIKSLVTDILFDLQAADEALVKLVGPLIEQSFELGGQQAIQEDADARGKKSADPFNIHDPRVIESISSRKTKITGINRTLRMELRERMAKAVRDGEGRQELAEAIRKQYKIAGNRAQTIAITEIGGAVEESRQHGRVQAGVPFKSWLHSRAEKGRPHHRMTEDATMAKPVPTNRKFAIAVTGVKTMYPRGSGKASEDVRCGCTSISRYPEQKALDLRNILNLQTKGFMSFQQLQLIKKGFVR